MSENESKNGAVDVIINITSENNDVFLFNKFLNHPDFPQHRNMILKAFPELEKQISNSIDEATTVKNFVDKYYKINFEKISSIIEEARTDLESSGIALKALGQMMDYKWDKAQTYSAIPTILPFSPFSGKTFNFSILDRINGTGKRSILNTAIHEISHFVFFDLLMIIERENNLSLSSDAKYYLKEALTAAIFNEEPLKSILKIDVYSGNPEVRDLYIKSNEKTPRKFVDFIRSLYSERINDKKSFSFFLTDLVLLVEKISKELTVKRKIWNTYGKDLIKNPEVFLKYQEPIMVRTTPRSL